MRLAFPFSAVVLLVLLVSAWCVFREPRSNSRTEPEPTETAQTLRPSQDLGPTERSAPSHHETGPSVPTTSEREPTDLLRVRVSLREQPLESAEVFALPWNDEIEALAQRSVGLPESVLQTTPRRIAGVDGLVSFSSTEAARLLIVGRGPGSAPGGRLVTIASLTEALVDLDLPPEQTIHGTTWTWPEQTRLPGALVRARRAYRVEHTYGDSFEPVDRVAGMFFRSEIRTDGAASYKLGGLPAARVFVIATAEGRSATHYVDRVLPVDEPISLSLLAGTAITGTVLDASDMNPLDGVRVVSISKADGKIGWESDHAFTDTQGRFSLTAPLDGDIPYGVRACFDGYMTSEQLVAGRGPHDVTVLLQRAPMRDFLVRDSEERPIRGSTVGVLESGSYQYLAFGSTNAAGVFRAPLSNGLKVEAYARAAGFAEEWAREIDVSDLPITFVLEKNGGIEGVVTSSGAPLSNAVIRARRQTGDGRWLSDDRVESDSIDGTFAISGLIPGDYVVDVHPTPEAPGYAPTRVEFTLDPGETKRVDVEMLLGVTVSGSVRSASSGAPVVGAMVSLADQFRHGAVSGALPDGATTDVGGFFTLSGTPPGDFRLLVEHSEFVSLVHEVEIVDASSPVDIRLLEPAELVVRMARAEDMTPVDFSVSVRAESGLDEHLSSTEGEARFTNLPPGRVSVTSRPVDEAWAGGVAGRTFGTEVSLRAGETRLVELKIEGTATLRGSVVVPAELGVAASSLSVVVEPVASSFRRGLNWIAVEKDGTFEFPTAPRGEVVVWLTGGAESLSVAEFRHLHLLDGQESVVNFHVPISGLRGRVTTASGRPLKASMRIRTSGPRTGVWTSFNTDDNGEFRHVREPGPIEWTVGAEGFGTQVRTGMISDEQTVLTERIVLHPESRLTVAVTDLAGTPLDTVDLTLTPLALPEADDAFRQRPLGAGRWMLRRIGEGRHSLEVKASGFLTAHDELSFSDGSRQTKKLRLRRAVDLELLVVDQDDQVLPNEPVRFEAADDDELDGFDARTDNAGRLVVRVAEGTYELVVRSQRDLLDLTGETEPMSAVLKLE